MIKKRVALILVLLLSIENFAAVVGDNDGAAFITKAEFDSLKNNFQAQIDQYNTSIDSKIDGAIASYLSGISVEKQRVLEPEVENFSDIFWVHDFSLVNIEKTENSRNSWSKSANGAHTPDYTNFEGWTYWRYNRGIKGNILLWNNFCSGIIPYKLAFNSDGTYTKTSYNSTDYDGFTWVTPLLCLCASNDWVLDASSPLKQLVNGTYNGLSFGAPCQSDFTFQLYNNSGSVYYKILQPSDSTAYIGFALIYWIGTARYEQHYWVTTDNSEMLPVEIYDYGTREFGTRTDDPQKSRTLTYPLNGYYTASDDQSNFDILKIANMMCGTVTSFKCPILFDLKLGGRTGKIGNIGLVGDTLSDGARWSYPDWTNWNKKTIDVTVNLAKTFAWAHDLDQNSKIFPLELASGATNAAIWAMPVTTLFDFKKLKSPNITWNNKNLEICGGLPIVTNLESDGKLNIKLECTKGNDDVTKSAPTDCDAHIKFKKSNFMDSQINYFTGSYENHTNVTFDGSDTLDLGNVTFSLDVKRGESIWLNVDPITLGQHIKINNMQVTLVTD